MIAILQALGTGAGLLAPVLILVVLACIAAARRGEAGVHVGGIAHDTSAAGSGAVPHRLPFVPDREPTVLEILILGVVLFTLVMGGLLGLSLLGQMG